MIVTESRIAVKEIELHPIFDRPEEKRNGEGLGLMYMSPTVKFLLLGLRVYLFAMIGMLGYHVLDLAGFVGHHGVR